VCSVTDVPSPASSRTTWNLQPVEDGNCCCGETFPEGCGDGGWTLLPVIKEGSFSGIQSLILTIFILPSFRIVTRNALAGWPTACFGWCSRISSILYSNDFSESVPSTKNSSNLGLPKSSHKKEAAASGKRSFHESVVVWYTCRMGKNNERFSIL